MKHIGVILFSYFISIFLLILPVVIFEGVSEKNYFLDGVAVFFYYTIMSFPLIAIFMSLHHFLLYIIQKRGWLQMSFVIRILIGASLGLIYIAMFIFNGRYDSEFFLLILSFTYLGLIYEMSCVLMKKLNWWTLFNQKKQ